MKKYLSPSSFNRFAQCSAAALAVERGEWAFEFTPAMKVGSYVDAYFSGTLDKFKEENSDIFTKQGKLRSDFVKAEEVIELIKSDPIFLEYVTGDMQVKATGEIGDVPFLGYIDSLHWGRTGVDLKVVKNIRGKYWSVHKRSYETWVDAFNYPRSLAIYQELVRQMTGKKLPFFLAAVDKQKHPDHELIHIDDATLKLELETVEARASEFMKIRAGKLPPIRCGKCDYCLSTKKITEPISHLELLDF